MRSTFARRLSVVTSALAFVAAIASAQTTKPNANNNAADQQVRQAQQQMLQAALRGDKDAVSRFLADDLAWVGRNGEVLNKDQMLSTALPAPVKSIDVQQVLPMGSTATVVAIVHPNDGTDRRALQEWVNRDGQWKIVSHESTPISSAASSSGMTGASPTGTSGAASGEGPRTVEPTLNTDEDRAIWKTQTDMVDAYGKGDTTRYSALTATPFTRVESDGQVYNRRQWLDRVGKNAKQPLKNGAISDFQVKVDNDNGLAVATMQIVPFNQDGTPRQPERQTRIFAKRDGHWQQVAAISAPITGK